MTKGVLSSSTRVLYTFKLTLAGHCQIWVKWDNCLHRIWILVKKFTINNLLITAYLSIQVQ